MIAGTPFELTYRPDRVVADYRHRVDRARTPEAFIRECITACYDGDALCFWCEDGFFMMKLGLGLSGKVRAKVLLAVSRGGSGAIQHYIRHVMAIARDMGAQELSFRSDRTGWRRMLGPEWSEDDGTFYRSL